MDAVAHHDWRHVDAAGEIDDVIGAFVSGRLDEAQVIDRLRSHRGEPQAMARVAEAYLAGELPVGALGVVQKQEPSTVAERMRLMEPWELAEFTHSAVLTATRIARDVGTGEDRSILAQERALPLDDVAARIALVERCHTVIDG